MYKKVPENSESFPLVKAGKYPVYFPGKGETLDPNFAGQSIALSRIHDSDRKVEKTP